MFYVLVLQLVTEKLKSTYKHLKEITSAEMNFQRYRQEIQAVHQTPCVPRLSKILSLLLMLPLTPSALVPLVIVHCYHSKN